MKSLPLLLALMLALAGCATAEPAPSKTAPLAQMTYEVALVPSCDDPEPVFAKAFPEGRPIKKDPLDTQAEYRAKLAALGVEGSEKIFLIQPELCDILPFPEESFYFIVSFDTHFSHGSGPIPVTIRGAADARPEVIRLYGRKLQLALTNVSEIRQSALWDHEGAARFGLPIKNADPKFRELLRGNKLGLAVRVRIGDLTQKTDDRFRIRDDMQLPSILLEAWIVDTSTNTTIAHWHPPAPKK